MAKSKKAEEPTIWEQVAAGTLRSEKVPAAERARWVALADKLTTHNNTVVQAVWRNQKARTALKYKDEGGELERVGWPGGYKPELDPRRAKAAAAPPPRTPRAASPARVAAVVPTALAGKRIKLLVKGNPKREGTIAFTKFACYRNGQTVEEYIEAGAALGFAVGALRADVALHIAKGYIAVS